jgi:hypothetical protein
MVPNVEPAFFLARLARWKHVRDVQLFHPLPQLKTSSSDYFYLRWLCGELSWDSRGEVGCHNEKGGRRRNQTLATPAHARQSVGIVLFHQPLRMASYPQWRRATG